MSRTKTTRERRRVQDRRKKVTRPLNVLTAKAIAVNQLIHTTGVLPKPRIEVRKVTKGFAYRQIDKYGRKGDWSERFSLRNNTRRAARKAHPGLPVVSQ